MGQNQGRSLGPAAYWFIAPTLRAFFKRNLDTSQVWPPGGGLGRAATPTHSWSLESSRLFLEGWGPAASWTSDLDAVSHLLELELPMGKNPGLWRADRCQAIPEGVHPSHSLPQEVGETAGRHQGPKARVGLWLGIVRKHLQPWLPEGSSRSSPVGPSVSWGGVQSCPGGGAAGLRVRFNHFRAHSRPLGQESSRSTQMVVEKKRTMKMILETFLLD